MKWCEVFKAGTHTDSKGNKKTWTIKDLDEIVANFNDKNPDVPLVIGHPRIDAPAYGWVEALKREGDKLFAAYKDVAAEFAEWVKGGRYRTRSISLKDNVLRHIGWLGGTPPAIKGLEAYQFAEDEDVTIYDFSENAEGKFSAIAGCFENMRDFFIEKFGLEKTDKLIPKWDIEYIKKNDDTTAEAVSAYSEISDTSGKEQDLTVQNPQTADKPTATVNDNEFAQAVEAKEKEIADLKAQLEAEKAEKRKAEFSQFADELLKNGNITTAQKPVVIDFMEVCSIQGEYEFAEGDDKSVLNRFKDLLKSVKQVEFSEISNNNTVDLKNGVTVDFSDGASIANGIEVLRAEYSKQGIEKSNAQLLAELKKGNQA